MKVIMAVTGVLLTCILSQPLSTPQHSVVDRCTQTLDADLFPPLLYRLVYTYTLDEAAKC